MGNFISIFSNIEDVQNYCDMCGVKNNSRCSSCCDIICDNCYIIHIENCTL